MCWICRKLLHEDFAKKTVAHQIMELVLVNLTDDSSFYSKSSEEEKDWKIKKIEQVEGVHTTHLHYIMHFAHEVWFWWEELSGMISWQVSQMAPVQ
jgi:hypothetical protein